MSRRALLALSATVSAFVLVLIGAVAAVVIRSSPAPTAQAAEAVPVDVVRQRESEYRRLLDEANARLRAQQATAFEPAPRAEVAPAFERDRSRDEEDEERGSRREHHEEDDDG